MKKNIVLVVAAHLFFVSFSFAHNGVKGEGTDNKSDKQTQIARITHSLVEKPLIFIEKKEPEAPHKKHKKSPTILSLAYSSALAHQTTLQDPKQTPQLNEASLETNKVAASPNDTNQGNDYLDEKFKWASASRQSLLFLGFQHSFRFTKFKTRVDLKGPVFRDYIKSIKTVKGWDDGDSFLTNYIGHPAMGAVGGYIYIQNDPKASKLEFSRSRKYWNSRLKAMAWSAAYSTQFEIGLLSEASIGNVGMGDGRNGYVDLVITPTMGTAGIVLEDLADSYLIRQIEKRTQNPGIIRFVRILLNPTRSFANLLRFKTPWHRDNRGMVF